MAGPAASAGHGRGAGRVETVHRARMRARADGVDRDDPRRVLPGGHERAGIPVALEHGNCFGDTGRGAPRATNRPAASSPRPSVPTPTTTVMICSTVRSRKWVAQEMQGSWLRIACSQRRVSSSSCRSSREVDERAQVGLDRALVLRCRRHDPGVGDRAVALERVAVVQAPARRLGHRRARTRARRDLDGRRVRRARRRSMSRSASSSA